MPNQIMISDHLIPIDELGRVSLNALHQASELGTNKAPSQWVRTQSAINLIKEVTDMQICTSPLVTVKGGANQGSFAHELLAVSYAGWISPKFQLMVNQAFIDARKVDAVAEVPAYIRQELLRSNPLWSQLQRYYALHLTQVEMGKLLNCSATSIREQLKRMARCGLIDYHPNLKLSKAGRKAHLLLINGR